MQESIHAIDAVTIFVEKANVVKFTFFDAFMLILIIGIIAYIIRRKITWKEKARLWSGY